MYRTTVKGLSLAANSVLDVGEPVRDYAKVGRQSWSTSEIHS